MRIVALDRWGSEAVAGVLDSVSAALTTEARRDLNRHVQAGATIPEVAEAWLIAQGIVTS